MKLWKVLQTKLPDWVEWPFSILHGLVLLIVVSEVIHLLMRHASPLQ